MVTLDCELKDLRRQVTKIGIDDLEYRLVGNWAVNTEYLERLLVDGGCKGGWVKDWEIGAWFPIEEPLPKLPGTPVCADVSLRLTSIMYGWIAITVEGGGKTLSLWIDDIKDSPVLLVRFVQVLAAGGEPHAALAGGARAHFIVQDGPDPLLCRFHIEGQSESEIETIDVLTDRNKLLHQFRSLTTTIADHPSLRTISSAMPVYQMTNMIAWLTRRRLNGRAGSRRDFSGDDVDAQEQFTTAKIVTEVPLPEDCAKLAKEERAMLRSLDIPREWLARYGLSRYTTSESLPVRINMLNGHSAARTSRSLGRFESCRTEASSSPTRRAPSVGRCASTAPVERRPGY